MSMNRDAAIAHFASRSKSTLTAAQHLEQAPEAVRKGLAPRDLEWIKHHPDILAVQAAAHLRARSLGNPDGAL